MKIEILQTDPLGVLNSTKPIVEKARFVFINQDKLVQTAAEIEKRFQQGLSNQEMGFTETVSLENDVQLIFIEDVVNFCFWSSKNISKWQVEKPDGTATTGGWYGLKTCFERGLAEGIPILNPRYLSAISMADGRSFFRGINGTQIPLLEKRVDNLQEAGKILLQKFDSKFINVIDQSNYDAINLTKLIVENFSSFKDVSTIDGKKVFFFKRAQICPNDLTYILKTKGKILSSLDKLTAFADYKLPQILRLFGVLDYDKSLAHKVDNYIELTHDSREEIEIRAATVWAVELLRQKSSNLTARDIDNTIWLMSQGIQKNIKPYHRTKTIFY